ncbi:MAG TPA: 50S ribosomal protein L18 [Candidatus Hydrogenedentes bacterium]|nr:50S ribosomal protein L18 [Candidatus Hydrogenedentota bacterium]
MARKSRKVNLLERRKRRVRKTVSGSADRPRLRVTRTLKHIYAQIIDDTQGRILTTVSSLGLKVAGGNVAGATEVGKALGEQAVAKGIRQVCFDRGGRLYHGRVKALADAAREAGLQF